MLVGSGDVDWEKLHCERLESRFALHCERVVGVVFTCVFWDLDTWASFRDEAMCISTL